MENRFEDARIAKHRGPRKFDRALRNVEINVHTQESRDPIMSKGKRDSAKLFCKTHIILTE